MRRKTDPTVRFLRVGDQVTALRVIIRPQMTVPSGAMGQCALAPIGEWPVVEFAQGSTAVTHDDVRRVPVAHLRVGDLVRARTRVFSRSPLTGLLGDLRARVGDLGECVLAPADHWPTVHWPLGPAEVTPEEVEVIIQGDRT